VTAACCFNPLNEAVLFSTMNACMIGDKPTLGFNPLNEAVLFSTLNRRVAVVTVEPSFNPLNEAVLFSTVVADCTLQARPKFQSSQRGGSFFNAVLLNAVTTA